MIKFDEKKLAEVEATLRHIPKAAPKAISRAVNRAAQEAKTEAVRRVRDRYHIRAKDVNEVTKIKRSNPSTLVATIRAVDSTLPLSKFKITPNRRPGKKGALPVRARVLKSSSNKRIRGGFMATVGAGHKGAFIRAGKGKTRRKKRTDGVMTELPIEQNYGPSIPQMLGYKSVEDSVEKVATESMNKRLEHEVEQILKGVVK